jgi:hypothetical protein
MSYTQRFGPTDTLFAHLQTVLTGNTHSQLLSSFSGFLSVSAVTVFELAIKDIFTDFATKKNLVFGFFVDSAFSKLNGHIKLNELRENHIPKFGKKYSAKFDKILTQKENYYLSVNGVSIKSMYGNMIESRHNFVHKGNPTLSFPEVISSYDFCKEIIHCLNDAMKR